MKSKTYQNKQLDKNLFLPSFPLKSPNSFNLEKRYKSVVRNKIVTLDPVDKIKNQIAAAIHGQEKSKFNLVAPTTPRSRDRNISCSIHPLSSPPVRLKKINLHFKNLSIDSAYDTRIIFPSLKGSTQRHDPHFSNFSPIPIDGCKICLEKSPIHRERLSDKLTYKIRRSPDLNLKYINGKKGLKEKNGLRSSKSLAHIHDYEINDKTISEERKIDFDVSIIKGNRKRIKINKRVNYVESIETTPTPFKENVWSL